MKLVWKIIDGGNEILFMVDKYGETIESRMRLFDIPYRISVSGSEETKSVLIGNYLRKIAETKLIRQRTHVLQPSKRKEQTTAILVTDYEGDLHSFVYGYGYSYNMALTCLTIMNEMIFGTGNEIFYPHRDDDGWKVDFLDRPSENGDLLYVVSEYIHDGLIYQYSIDGNQGHSHGFEGVLSTVLDSVVNGKEISFTGFEDDYSEQEMRVLQKFIGKLKTDCGKNE